MRSCVRHYAEKLNVVPLPQQDYHLLRNRLA